MGSSQIDTDSGNPRSTLSKLFEHNLDSPMQEKKTPKADMGTIVPNKGSISEYDYILLRYLHQGLFQNTFRNSLWSYSIKRPSDLSQIKSKMKIIINLLWFHVSDHAIKKLSELHHSYWLVKVMVKVNTFIKKKDRCWIWNEQVKYNKIS